MGAPTPPRGGGLVVAGVADGEAAVPVREPPPVPSRPGGGGGIQLPAAKKLPAVQAELIDPQMSSCLLGKFDQVVLLLGEKKVASCF